MIVSLLITIIQLSSIVFTLKMSVHRATPSRSLRIRLFHRSGLPTVDILGLVDLVGTIALTVAVVALLLDNSVKFIREWIHGQQREGISSIGIREECTMNCRPL